MQGGQQSAAKGACSRLLQLTVQNFSPGTSATQRPFLRLRARTSGAPELACAAAAVRRFTRTLGPESKSSAVMRCTWVVVVAAHVVAMLQLHLTSVVRRTRRCHMVASSDAPSRALLAAACRGGGVWTATLGTTTPAGILAAPQDKTAAPRGGGSLSLSQRSQQGSLSQLGRQSN